MANWLLVTNYAPMNYTDENGVFTGFDTELATLTCESLVLSRNSLDQLENQGSGTECKVIDCIWNGLTIDDDRKATMEITRPYVNAQVVLIKEGTPYNGRNPQ